MQRLILFCSLTYGFHLRTHSLTHSLTDSLTFRIYRAQYLWIAAIGLGGLLGVGVVRTILLYRVG